MTINLGNLDPLNEDKFFEEFDGLEEDARKERVRSVLKERNDIVDTNRKLFARAKEAEGFKQEDDGSWVKNEKKSDAKPVKSDEGLLKRLDTMALKVAGITAEDEVELFNKWKGETGREADEITGNRIFIAELNDLRTAKANAAATNIKPGGEQSGQKDDPSYWIARATKDGEGNPVLPDDFPMTNTKLRQEVVAKFVSSEKKEDKHFYNS